MPNKGGRPWLQLSRTVRKGSDFKYKAQNTETVAGKHRGIKHSDTFSEGLRDTFSDSSTSKIKN